MDAPCPIRSATRDDLGAVGAIEVASFADPWSAADFQEALAGSALFLVAVQGAVVVGYVIARRAADEGEILNLAVAPAARGQGVGRRLAGRVLAELGAQGAVSVYLEVRESNDSARRLYGAMGFATVARRRRYYREPSEDALLLRVALGHPQDDAKA
jgi:ribosomal-protein-alanine N-acetyltransferase